MYKDWNAITKFYFFIGLIFELVLLAFVYDYFSEMIIDQVGLRFFLLDTGIFIVALSWIILTIMMETTFFSNKETEQNEHLDYDND